MSTCKKCQAASARAWYHANKERGKATRKAYAEANPEVNRKSVLKYQNSEHGAKQNIISQATYREANRELCNQRTRASYYKNPELYHSHARKRRGIVAGVKSERWDRIAVHEEANGRCLYCGVKVTIDEMEADHFVPISKGGDDTRDNIVCSCKFCNRSKGAKMPEDFIGRTL